MKRRPVPLRAVPPARAAGDDIKVTQKVYAPLGIEELRAAVENRGIAIAFPQSKRKKA
jgi:hypothetical protein